jgi:hypothetical protein
VNSRKNALLYRVEEARAIVPNTWIDSSRLHGLICGRVGLDRGLPSTNHPADGLSDPTTANSLFFMSPDPKELTPYICVHLPDSRVCLLTVVSILGKLKE